MRYPQNELIEKLFRAVGMMNRSRGRGRGMDPMRGQGRVLTLLRLHPEISQKELSYLLDMRPQSLSELLAKLEKRGYITRTPSLEDKRAAIISLTDAGRETEQAAQSDRSDPVFDCLSEEEQAKLSEYLDKLISALEELEEERGQEAYHGKEDYRGGHEHGSGRLGGQGGNPGYGREGPGEGRGRGRGGPPHCGDRKDHSHRRENRGRE